MILRRAVLVTAAVLALADGIGRAHAQAEAGPTAPAMSLYQGLDAVRQAARATPFAQLASLLTPVIQKVFNLDEVVRASIGLRYAALPAEQKAALLQVFTDYTVASYVANFAGDSSDHFTVDPTSRAVGADQVVTTHIVPASGTPTRLDYLVRQGAAGWQIVDVLIDGSISQVAVQRSDFRRLLGSGSAEPLIASLRKKTASLAAGGKG